MSMMEVGGTRHRVVPAAVAVGVLVLLTRLPFLTPGYGEHGDSRLIATAGRSIAETGVYTISRIPGYPQLELLAAAVWRGGPLLLNGLTALAGSAATVLFYLLLRRFGAKDPFLLALALAFTPAFFVSSVSTIDFPWTLAWVLAATLAALDRRPLLAGVFLGMAVGSRLTSGAMALPLVMILTEGGSRTRTVRVTASFAVAAALTGAAWYIPSLLSYGTSFVGYQPFATSLEWTFRTFVAEFWGIPGFAMLLVSLLAILWTGGKSELTSIPAGAVTVRVTIAFALAAAIYLGLYLRMPIKGAYLITALPFALVVLARYTPRRVFQALCCAILVSPFVLAVHPAAERPPYVSSGARAFSVAGKSIYVDPLRGPILADNAMRRSQLAFTHELLANASRLPDSSLILTGWNWSSYVRAAFIGHQDDAIVRDAFGFDDVRLFRPFRAGKVVFANLADSLQLRDYGARGWGLYYLEQAGYFNRLEHGTDPAREGALLLAPDPMKSLPSTE